MEEYRISEENFNQLLEEIDNTARATVGILMKRLEILEDKSLSPEQLHNIFKESVKEQIYEGARVDKRLIKAYLTIGRIEFKTRDK